MGLAVWCRYLRAAGAGSVGRIVRSWEATALKPSKAGDLGNRSDHQLRDIGLSNELVQGRERLRGVLNDADPCRAYPEPIYVSEPRNSRPEIGQTQFTRHD